jgi:protein-S-isoprenylcysteine O-methyltransferase Ste14
MRPTPINIGLQLVAALVVFLGLLLWLSSDWRWVEGWIFGLWWVSFLAAVLLWLRYRDPALYAERFRMPGSGGESRSDLAIILVLKAGFIAWLVLPALNVRFGWTPRLPLWCEACGAILLLGGSFPFFRAITDNTFASQLVRIQAERGQHVIDTGVYGFVRHPMYLGASLVLVGGALLLGSIAGLLLALAMVGLLVVRIFGEEKLLTRDLEGYQEYLQKVRYRLVPHIW